MASAIRTAQITNTLDLTATLRESRLENASDLAQFGNAELKFALNEGDTFARVEAQRKIKEEQTNIARKVFLSEYEYAYDDANTRMGNDTSSFPMIIPTGFTSTAIEEVLFPLPHVTRQVDRWGGAETIIFTVSGNTQDIQELVRNRTNYRAKVWFTNLRHESGGTFADVLKIEIVKVQ